MTLMVTSISLTGNIQPRGVLKAVDGFMNSLVSWEADMSSRTKKRIRFYGIRRPVISVPLMWKCEYLKYGFPQI